MSFHNYSSLEIFSFLVFVISKASECLNSKISSFHSATLLLNAVSSLSVSLSFYALLFLRVVAILPLFFFSSALFVFHPRAKAPFSSSKSFLVAAVLKTSKNCYRNTTNAWASVSCGVKKKLIQTLRFSLLLFPWQFQVICDLD